VDEQRNGLSTVVKTLKVVKKKKTPLYSIRFDDFDTKSVKILNEILEETGAEIVVSSDWKLHATLEELGEYYELTRHY
jgi:hypothetical protein